MRRAMYIGGIVLICGLSAFGAAELALGLGLGPVLATLACCLSLQLLYDRAVR
jgi:hypothetical protein